MIEGVIGSYLFHNITIKKMFETFKKKYLYFPGCLSNYVLPEIVENYRKIFFKLKIQTYNLSSLNCCGTIAYNNGYNKDFEEIRSKNLAFFNQNNVKNIVTNDPGCLKTLNQLYSLSTIHVTQLITKYIRKLPVKFDEKVNYYDSVSLNVYEGPRKILEALGFEIKELKRNKQNSVLCGAEGGLMHNLPSLANKISKEVFDMCTEKKLIVLDPLAYYHLKNNAPRNIQVMEMSEVII